MNTSHLTAKKRKKPSAPMRRLSADGRLRGRMLDYGCGKGKDADEYGMESYDPHYQPKMPDGMFDTITCNFVLNVIEDSRERRNILSTIKSHLDYGGKAYITVRNDRAALKGLNSRGNWQGHIVMNLPVLYRTGGYVTYELDCTTKVDLATQRSLT